MTVPWGRRPAEEECWTEFWESIGRAAAQSYLRERK